MFYSFVIPVTEKDFMIEESYEALTNSFKVNLVLRQVIKGKVIFKSVYSKTIKCNSYYKQNRKDIDKAYIDCYKYAKKLIGKLYKVETTRDD